MVVCCFVWFVIVFGWFWFGFGLTLSVVCFGFCCEFISLVLRLCFGLLCAGCVWVNTVVTPCGLVWCIEGCWFCGLLFVSFGVCLLGLLGVFVSWLVVWWWVVNWLGVFVWIWVWLFCCTVCEVNWAALKLLWFLYLIACFICCDWLWVCLLVCGYLGLAFRFVGFMLCCFVLNGVILGVVCFCCLDEVACFIVLNCRLRLCFAWVCCLLFSWGAC